MSRLTLRAFAGLLQLLIVLTAVIFVPARTIDYWQGWGFLAVFFASTVAITIYLMKRDPRLLERRVNAGPGAEKSLVQRRIQMLAGIAFLALFIVSGLDHRFRWSTVPAFVTLFGDLAVVLGLYFVFLVFRENTFAAGTIEVGADQKLIATGPYAIVRHPMYSSALLMLLGTPIALGSWWGLLAIIPMTLVIVWRLLDEELFLVKRLAGYTEYQRTVRYHLLPGIW
jgi:protein-S-isoprenylcysteine O-methyltransferase Ste14